MVLAVSATSATSAVPAQAASITGAQPATGTAVAVITHDPRKDEAPLPHSTRAALDIAMDRALANPAEFSVPYADFDTIVAPVRTTASQPAVDVASAALTVAASPLGLGSDDGSIAGDGVAEKPAAEPNAFSAQQAGPTMTVRPYVPKMRYGLAELYLVQQEVLEAALPGGWVHEGKSYVLTAGHCTSLNKPAGNHNGTMGTVSADNWNNNTGSVKWNGQSYYSGDVSTIKMSSGKASSYRVYRGGPNSGESRAVTDKWRDRSGNGDRYCVSGQKTGEMCGWKVISTHVIVRFGSRVLRNATEGHRNGTCTRGGDSGAPIYTIRSDGGAAAKGVLSGGSTNTSGSCWDYFTDTSLAEKALAGVLRVQAPR